MPYQKDQSRRTGIQEVLDAFIAPDAYENRYQREQRLRAHGPGDLIAGPRMGNIGANYRTILPAAPQAPLIAKAPYTAPASTAYAPMAPTQSPAQQAASAQARGSYSANQISALQKDLNTIGAGLKVDGIMGPLTRAAMSKYGVVSLPSAAAGIGSDYAGSQSRGPYADPQVAAMQMDLNSRGAALKVDGIRGPLTRTAEKQFLGTISKNRIAGAFEAAKPVRQLGTPYTSPTGDVASDRIAGGFDVAGTVRQLGSPYTGSTGGANAIQTARIPQARPAYPPMLQQALPTARLPQARPAYPPVQQAIAAPVPAAPLMYQLQQAQMLRNAAAAAQREAQARSASGSSRSGLGGGGGYTGGSYGGYGGGSITSGVGGAFKNR